MDRLDAHGLTGVFFVDPMPALVYEPGVVLAMISPPAAALPPDRAAKSLPP